MNATLQYRRSTVLVRSGALDASTVVPPVIGAAIGGVGALVMGLPGLFIAGGAVVGGFVGKWVASVATQTQE